MEKGIVVNKRIGRVDPGVILPMKDFLEISVISGEAVPSKYRPIGSQGYGCFQGQNGTVQL